MPGQYIPPVPITIAFASSQSIGSFTPTQTQQLQFITDTTNINYLRHMLLTQDGLYAQVGTASVFISKANIYAVASNALAPLSWPPVIVTQPTSSTITHPATTYFVVSASVAQGTSNPTFQWYSSSYAQSLVGQFSQLTASVNFTGSNTNALTCSNTNTGMSLSQLFCVCSNPSGQTTSSVATLTVL